MVHSPCILFAYIQTSILWLPALILKQDFICDQKKESVRNFWIFTFTCLLQLNLMAIHSPVVCQEDRHPLIYEGLNLDQSAVLVQISVHTVGQWQPHQTDPPSQHSRWVTSPMYRLPSTSLQREKRVNWYFGLWWKNIFYLLLLWHVLLVL